MSKFIKLVESRTNWGLVPLWRITLLVAPQTPNFSNSLWSADRIEGLDSLAPIQVGDFLFLLLLRDDRLSLVVPANHLSIPATS